MEGDLAMITQVTRGDPACLTECLDLFCHPMLLRMSHLISYPPHLQECPAQHKIGWGQHLLCSEFSNSAFIGNAPFVGPSLAPSSPLCESKQDSPSSGQVHLPTGRTHWISAFRCPCTVNSLVTVSSTPAAPHTVAFCGSALGFLECPLLCPYSTPLVPTGQGT